MVDVKHACGHCGGNSLWRGFIDGIKRIFGGKRRRDRLDYIPVDKITANPFQPREYVLDEPLAELKKSIEQYGIIVPLIVNKEAGGRYTLVAGQRRLQAARELGFRFVPSIVRNLNSRQVMEISYMENLHREELSKIDVVQMFDRIHRKYPRIEEGDLADAMGLQVAELRRTRGLLDLPVPVLEALRANMISEEHAEIIAAGLKDPDAQLETIELVYNEKLDLESTKELVDRVGGKEPAYVTAEASTHYHSPACPFAQLIPEDRREKFYNRKEVAKRGKVPCMQCL